MTLYDPVLLLLLLLTNLTEFDKMDPNDQVHDSVFVVPPPPLVRLCPLHISSNETLFPI